MTIDNFDDNLHADNPQSIYTQTQLDMLNLIEGHHASQPDKEALIISVSLSIIEAAVAYSMVASAGVFVGLVVALFPVALLWAIANHHADKVGLPEVYDELVENYHDTVE
jgi:hypothetical protein